MTDQILRFRQNACSRVVGGIHSTNYRKRCPRLHRIVPGVLDHEAFGRGGNARARPLVRRQPLLAIVYRHLHCLEVLEVGGVRWVHVVRAYWRNLPMIQFENAIERIIDCFLAAFDPAAAPIHNALLRIIA